VLVRDVLAQTVPRCDEPHEHGALARATNIIAGGPLGHDLHRDSNGVSPRAVTQCLKLAGLRVSAAEFFADAICHGAILVAVHCDDSEVRDAREILDVPSALLPGLRNNRGCPIRRESDGAGNRPPSISARAR
jgi:hypothetical protein